MKTQKINLLRSLFLSSGRFLIQGKLYEEWSLNEFLILLYTVNSIQSLDMLNTSKNKLLFASSMSTFFKSFIYFVSDDSIPTSAETASISLTHSKSTKYNCHDFTQFKMPISNVTQRPSTKNIHWSLKLTQIWALNMNNSRQKSRFFQDQIKALMAETSRRHKCNTNSATIDQGTHSKTIELQCWRWGFPALVTQKGRPTTTLTCRNSNRKSISRSWLFPSRTLCLNTACKPTYCQHSTTSSNKSAYYRGTQRRFPPKYI